MGAQAFVPRSLAAGDQSQPSAIRRARGIEAWALLAAAAAVFVVLSLASVTYDPDDPSLHGADWMGVVGAFVARGLVRGFGLAAWLVPVELLLIGAPLLRGRRPELVGFRVAGDTLLLVLTASLLQVALPEALVFGAARTGGNVGLLFGELMRGLFSAPGSFLLGFTGIGLILIGRASFSFIEWCERSARALERVRVLLLEGLRRVVAMWSQASRIRAEQDAERRRAPVIEAPDPDAAILHHLEDDAPWIPMEFTGVPPLSISESLRQSLCPSDDEYDLPEHPTDRVEPPTCADSIAAPDVELDGTERLVTDDGEEDEPSGDGPADASVGAALAEDSLDFWSGALHSPTPLEEPVEEDVDEDEAGQNEEICESESLEEEDEEQTILPPGPRIVESSLDALPQATHSPRSRAARGEFELPPTSLLEEPQEHDGALDRPRILAQAELLESCLRDYGVTGKVEEIHPGPTVTTYEVAPTAGTKVSKVAGLSDDLALGLSRKVRIIAPIPGKSRIGFELPNDQRQPVSLRELVEDERFDKLANKAPLPVVLGRDIVGAPFYADLASMPHVIVAGATGAGKSVGLNVMLSSLLFRRTPEDLRLLMVDPKVVELAPFDKIPHLLLPVVTDMKQAAQALKWAVDEMERRYQLFADAGTKNITTYNRWVKRVLDGELPVPLATTVEAVDENGVMTMVPASKNGSDGAPLPEKLPYIVVVVDEFADLMMQQGKEVEASVARLAQKARAAGMHVILATQRPSVDVITGMIKANFPSRIAYRVAQKVDSRTILDEQGAEVLLGKGDMLVKLNGATDTLRVQCPFVSEEEVSALTDHLRAQGEPQYQESILEQADEDDIDPGEEKVDTRFDEAVQIVMDTGRCSTSWLQRKMTIGYNRAAKIVETMERRGYVGPPNGSRDREIFFPGGGG